jgi:SPP1 gp7 family putative phage head morphogenesis protein
MPGAASPTAPPQGLNAPSVGQMSPLAMQLANERGYANTYGGFLPRQPRTFTQGAFGPFSPILPVPVDEPAPGADMPDARLWEYTTGWNLPVGQPGSEGIKLANFGTLKTLADLYSVARACIELRKNEISGLDWDIVPTRDAAKAYHGSPRQMRDFGERRGKALKFFRKPDPDYFSFATFLSAMMEEVFVFDALSLLIRPRRGYQSGLGRGVLGSELDALELISGPTMRPLIGMHGETPRPPNPAYQQYLYGVPRSDYMSMITERDIDEGGLAGAEVNSWSADQFIYHPIVPRRWTPYGDPPIERALVPVISGLQKQAYQLDFFKEGTVPAVYISPGDVNMTPNQIRELQEALNAIAGDVAWHHKVIVLPPGSRVDPQKPVDVADQFDEIVMTQVCMAFDVNPMELGILPKVAATATPSAVKQMAQASASIHERISTKPTLKYIADIFDAILHNVMRQDDMKFTFEGLQEDSEQGMLTDLLIKQVQSGLRSVDEAREQLELQPWGLDVTSGPVTMTAAGVVPFGALMGSPGGDQKGPPTPSKVPLQQTGRQGGEAAPTPGHAAAAAANTSASRGGRIHTPTPSAPASGSVSAEKAQLIPAAARSELDALARHLNKGRHISSWERRNIPVSVLAAFEEDLTKGLTPDECAGIAKTMISLPAADYEWLPKAGARRDAPWERISDRYSAEIADAFSLIIAQVTILIREWWAGDVVMTRQSLLDQAEQIIRDGLWPVLSELWAESWRQNDETAGGYFEAWRDTYGLDALQNIARSRRRQLDQAIQDAVSSGGGPDQVISQLRSLLDADNRSAMIAITETGSAATGAAHTRLRAQGTTFKEWVTANDARVCGQCKACQAEGAIPLDSLFSNGRLGPPAHPRCRCDLVPAMTAGVDLTKEATLTKEQANYRVSDDGEHCGNCSMIRVRPPDFESYSCTLVKGLIDPSFVCDHWEAEKVSKELHPGEKDVQCERGHTHHGEYGAAGLLIRHQGDDGKTRYLLQKRSVTEDDPGTWSVPGGAALEGESAYDAAFREAQEEMGPLPASVTPSHHVVDDHGGWAFTTIVCDSPDMFMPDMGGAQTPEESSGFAWLTPKEINDLPLHPGFDDSWQAVTRTRKNTTLGKCAVRRVDISGQVTWAHPDPCPCKNAPGGGGPTKYPHDANDIYHGHAPEVPCTDNCLGDGRTSVSIGGGTAEHTDDKGGVRHQVPNKQPGDAFNENGDDTEFVEHREPNPPNRGIPQGYQGGHWPASTPDRRGQAGTLAVGGATSTGPTAASLGRKKNKGVLDRVLAPAEPKVMAQLEENFPAQALEWVSQAEWAGPLLISLNLVDFHDMETWSAFHEPDRVEHFEHLIQEGGEFNPVVMIKVPGHEKYRVVDGHHRALAFLRLNRPVKAWTGKVPFGLEHIALETHSSQVHQGDSKGNQ